MLQKWQSVSAGWLELLIDAWEKQMRVRVDDILEAFHQRSILDEPKLPVFWLHKETHTAVH